VSFAKLIGTLTGTMNAGDTFLVLIDLNQV